MTLARRRAVFVAYALAVLALLLWPALELPAGPVPRPDLVAHLGVFGLFTLLLVAARPARGPALGPRNLAVSGAGSLVFASGAELAQGLPGVNRFVTWEDGLANAMGVFGAITACLLLGAIEEDARA